MSAPAVAAPAPAECAGGQHTMKSPSGKKTCIFVYATKQIGQTQNVFSSVLGTDEAKGLCLAGGRWQFTASCSDPGIVSCPAGEQQVGQKCWFIWSSSVAGQSQTATDRNGTGSTFSATCGSEGKWEKVSLPVNKCD